MFIKWNWRLKYYLNVSFTNLIDLEPVYDIAPPRGNFQGYDFLNPHGSGHLLVKVCKVLLGLKWVMGLWNIAHSYFPAKTIDLEPVYDLAHHDFPNLHGSCHSLVKVCKVLLGRKWVMGLWNIAHIVPAKNHVRSILCTLYSSNIYEVMFKEALLFQ